MAELFITVTGTAAGIIFGRRQLKQWECLEPWWMAVLTLSCLLIFGAGSFLMIRYDYHWLKILRYLILMYGLVLLGVVDGKKKIIPNHFLLLLLGARTLLMAGDIAAFPMAWREILLSAGAGMLGGGLLFLLANVITRRGIGMGDVKMAAVMGFYLGFQVLMSSLVIILVLTALSGIGLIAIKKMNLHAEIPFAPFAAVGTILALLMGV